MRAATIAQLAWYKTPSESTAGLYSCESIPGLSESQLRDIMHYATCHKNLHFGWDFAIDMAASTLPFPAFLEGDDLYVWRAYQYLKGAEDPVIAGAVAITSEGNKNLRNQIHALLVSEDVDHEFVSDRLSISLEVVKAYEKLFFNVLDRKADHAFIASVVYPDGRMVEAMEDYLETTGFGDLMMRAGLTNGKDFVLYAGGIGKHPFASLDAAEGAARMDKQFMIDGCFYALSGWQHQRRNAMPILNARLSMQASKMGNKQEVAGEVIDVHLSDTLREEIEQISTFKAAARAKKAALALTTSLPDNKTTPD